MCSSTRCDIVEGQVEGESSSAISSIRDLIEHVLADKRGEASREYLDYDLTSRRLANNTPVKCSSARGKGTWKVLVTAVLTEELLDVETCRSVDVSSTSHLWSVMDFEID